MSPIPLQNKMHLTNPEQVFPTPFNGYILYQVIILFTEREADGTLYKDAGGLTQFDYGNNNSQIVNGVRPALSNENGIGSRNEQ